MTTQKLHGDALSEPHARQTFIYGKVEDNRSWSAQNLLDITTSETRDHQTFLCGIPWTKPTQQAQREVGDAQKGLNIMIHIT